MAAAVVIAVLLTMSSSYDIMLWQPSMRLGSSWITATVHLAIACLSEPNAVRCQDCLQGSGGTMQIMTKNRATPCRFLVGDDFAAWRRIYLEPLECTLLELFLQNSVDKPLSVVFDLYLWFAIIGRIGRKLEAEIGVLIRWRGS